MIVKLLKEQNQAKKENHAKVLNHMYGRNIQFDYF